MVSSKKIQVGTIRVDSKNLLPYIKTAGGWRRVEKELSCLLDAVKCYDLAGRFEELVDGRNPRFLKGGISPDGLPTGTRINILPNGEKLEKAFSLFSPNLLLHDELSHDHWDVIYQNKGGTWSYVYTLKKRRNHLDNKYSKVEIFEKNYKILAKNVKKGLLDESDHMAVPMHTLLETYMRVGNQTYYKIHGHSGLTTLVKKNISIQSPKVMFNYLSKGGVPISTSKEFVNEYIDRLDLLLRIRKDDEFVFQKNRMVLRERDFKNAFVKYCGHEFYPHIVRSHYATMKVKGFLKKEKQITKDKMKKLFMQIAHDLGHKRFDKKKQDWQDSYTVTIHSYVQPELMDAMQRRLDGHQSK